MPSLYCRYDDWITPLLMEDPFTSRLLLLSVPEVLKEPPDIIDIDVVGLIH